MGRNKEARRQYEANTYDTITFKARKGKNAEWTEAAGIIGLGKMEMFRRAIDEFIARHGNGIALSATDNLEPKITAQQKKLLDAVDALPEDAQKTLLKFLQQLAADNQHVDEKNPNVND